jgi:hypothetical protein
MLTAFFTEKTSPHSHTRDYSRAGRKVVDIFCLKNWKIRADLSIPGTTGTAMTQTLTCSLQSSSPATEDEVRKIIQKAPTKSCGLDPVLTTLLKEHLDTLIPIVTEIVNLSLTSGTVPTSKKQALVSPLLKKPSLDCEILKKLQTSFKFVICVQSWWASCGFKTWKLYECQQSSGEIQSAYKRHHGTETALIRITLASNILLSQRRMCGQVLKYITLGCSRSVMVTIVTKKCP